MKTKLIPIIVAAFGLATSPALIAQGCCGGGGSSKEGCPMAETAGGHEGHGGVQAIAANSRPSTSPKIFTEPVQSVYDNYIMVQEALAQDSLKGVSTAAGAMVKAIQGDSMKMLSPKLAQQVEALAKSKDLSTARDAFKSLSDSLISHLKEQKVPVGAYYIAYCPMAKASWLQTSKTIVNPYMGTSMVHCGQIKT